MILIFIAATRPIYDKLNLLHCWNNYLVEFIIGRKFRSKRVFESILSTILIPKYFTHYFQGAAVKAVISSYASNVMFTPISIDSDTLTLYPEVPAKRSNNSFNAFNEGTRILQYKDNIICI